MDPVLKISVHQTLEYELWKLTSIRWCCRNIATDDREVNCCEIEVMTFVVEEEFEDTKGIIV